MTHQFPIFFARRDLVEGNGFVAGVAVRGRALLTQEAEAEFWMEGVNPGGFSANGTSPAEALAAFCEEYRTVLFDIAGSSASFAEFAREVQEFFADASPVIQAEWGRAVEQVRAEQTTLPWLRVKKPATTELDIKVELISQPAARNNTESSLAMAY